MNRFFVSPHAVNTAEKTIKITGEDVKHLGKVLRLAPGDQIEVCDGVEWEYQAAILSIEKDHVWVSYQSVDPIATEPPIQVTLYQGVPKADKMELIIQKTVELGVVSVVPVMTRRTVVQFHTAKDQEKKGERWQKIGAEAAKQSKRGRIPQVHLPMNLQQALNHSRQNQLNILAYEAEKSSGLKELLRGQKDTKGLKVGIWIGPEGGYDSREVSLAVERGIHPVTLGPRILRTETAGLSLLTMLLYELGDLGGY